MDDFHGMSLLADVVLKVADVEHKLAKTTMKKFENIHKEVLAPMENVTK